MNRNSKEKRSLCNYRKSKLYKRYSKYCLSFGGYPFERDSQSDRNKMQRHLASKSLRRGIKKETDEIIQEMIEEV